MTTSPVASSTVGTTVPPPTTATCGKEGERRQTWGALPFHKLLESILSCLTVPEIGKLTYVSKRYAWFATHPIADHLGFDLPCPLTSLFTLQALCVNIKAIRRRLEHVSRIYEATIPGYDIQRTVDFLHHYPVPGCLKGIRRDSTILNCLIAASPVSDVLETNMVGLIRWGYTINATTIHIAFVRGSAFMLEALLEQTPATILKPSLSKIFSFLPALLTDEAGGSYAEKMEKILICLKRGASFELYFHLSREDWLKIARAFTGQGQVIKSGFILEWIRRLNEMSEPSAILGVCQRLFSDLVDYLPCAVTDECIAEAFDANLEKGAEVNVLDNLIDARKEPLNLFIIKLCLQHKRFIYESWGALNDVALPKDIAEREQLSNSFLAYREYWKEEDTIPDTAVDIDALAAWLNVEETT